MTMTITHWIGLTCLLPFSVSAGEWDAVSYHFTPGEENRVLGPNEAYTSVRPDSGEWTANFGVSNHFANLKGEQIRVYFFHLHQEAAYTEVADNIDHYMGLFTPWLEGQVRPKDAYFAVRTVIQVLDQSAYKGRIETPSRVWCLHFEQGSEAIIVLWCLDDDITMTLENASILKSVTSMVGTPQLVKSRLTVSGRPLYLRSDASDAERLKQQIRESHWEKEN